MSRVLTFAAVAMAIVGLTTVAANAALVGHWEFDNSGNVGEATVSSSLLTVGDAAYSASGKIGGALALDGAGDYLRVDGSDTLAAGMPTGDASFTQAAFIKTSNNARNGIIGWGTFGSSGRVNAFRTGDGAALTHYSWGGAFDYNNVAAPTIFDDQWHHVAATYDSATSTKRIYFDGAEIGTGIVLSDDLNVGGVNFRVGSTNNGEFFNGLLDDVRVYDTALSQSEISALASASGPGPGPGTIVVSPLPNDETAIVNTGGTLVSAANFGSQAGGNTTVNINGISHPVASAANNGPGADLISGVVAINSTFDGNYRSGQASAAGYTGDMLDLMGGIAGTGAPGPISLDISGLNVGTTYLFQGYWEANDFGQTASVTFEGTDTQGGITGVGGLGTLISYTFTAGDSVLDADLSKTGGSDNIWWQGYSLQEAAGGGGGGPIILVDYDDGDPGNGIHDSAVRNGGFESPNTGVDGEPFSNTDNWVNIEGDQDTQARRTNIKDTGAYTSVNSNVATREFALDTERILESGDILSLEFRARGASGSTNASAITAYLYYTDDDTIGGTPTVIDSIVTSDFANLTTSFATFSDTFSPISGAAVGKNLFLGFDQSAGPGFTRTDGWYLTVEPAAAAIPEPSTFALAALGLLGFGVIGWRKRRK